MMAFQWLSVSVLGRNSPQIGRSPNKEGKTEPSFNGVDRHSRRPKVSSGTCYYNLLFPGLFVVGLRWLDGFADPRLPLAT